MRNAVDRGVGVAALVSAAVVVVPAAEAVLRPPTVLPNAPLAAGTGGFGAAVDGIGDMNGDGVSDAVIGAPVAGRAFLIPGTTRAVVRPLVDPDGLTGTLFGMAVAGVGDVNGDRVEDVAVGAPSDAMAIPIPCPDDECPGAGARGRAPTSSRAPLGLCSSSSRLPSATSSSGRASPGERTVSGDGVPDVVVGAPVLTNDRDEMVFAFPAPAGRSCGRRPSRGLSSRCGPRKAVRTVRPPSEPHPQSSRMGSVKETRVTIDPHPERLATVDGEQSASRGVQELIGRQLLHDHLRLLAESASAGRGRLVLLAGEPGIGKSSLAADLTRRCAEDGFLVLWGTGWDGEGTPAFWPWVEALRGCAAALGEGDLGVVAISRSELGRLLPELAPRLVPGAGTAGPTTTAGEGAQFRLFDAVWSLLRLLARRRPVAVVLDDPQWADPASLDLLRFVAARAQSAAVMLVGAYREVEIGPDHPLRGSLAALRSLADFIPVAGLDVGAVGELLVAVGGRPVAPDVVATAHRRTGGNPFCVREVARLMQVQGELMGLPDAVRDVVNRRLARLSRPCHDLLRLAAVVGQESDVPLLAEVSRLAEAAVVDLVREAEEGRVLQPSSRGVDGMRFAHDLFRETLYAAGPAAAAMHRQVGRVLEERKARGAEIGASELAHHFLRAGGDLEDRARAVRYSADAAREAIALLAPHQGLAHARRALAALDAQDEPDEELRLEVLLVVADAERRAGEGAHSRLTLERAAVLARRLGAGEGLARAALIAQLLGDDYGTGGETTRALLQEAAAELAPDAGETGGTGEGAESELRARVLAAMARHLYHHDRTCVDEAQRLAAAAVEAAESSKNASALAHALFAQHDVSWRPGTAPHRLEIARRLEAVAVGVDPELRAEAVLLGAIAGLERCDATAGDELRRYSRLATALRDPRFQYLALTRQITVAIMHGELETAEELLEQASLLGRAVAEPDQWHVEMRELWVLRALQGRRDELEARVRSWPYPVFLPWYAAQVVLSICDRGAFDEAASAGARLAAFDPAAEPPNNLWLVQTATVAEAAAAVGDRDLAARLYDALTPYAGLGVVTGGAVDFYGAVDHYLGLLAATLDRREAAAGHLVRAVAQHRQLGATPWVSRSQRALADLAGPAPAGGGPAATPDVTRGIFRREGERWTLGLDGQIARMADAKGLHDIRTLLSAPGRTVAAADLLAATTGQEASEDAAFGADEVLDGRARAAYRARLAELDEEVSEAERHNDVERLARARFERQLLADELAAALGLGGRSRLLGSGGERARKAVTARIRNSLRRMERSHTALAAHLSASITTGTSCSYLPAEPVIWET
ncbi:MAG: AAA family ATPase [Acidimicrobiales bacterium]